MLYVLDKRQNQYINHDTDLGGGGGGGGESSYPLFTENKTWRANIFEISGAFSLWSHPFLFYSRPLPYRMIFADAVKFYPLLTSMWGGESLPQSIVIIVVSKVTSWEQKLGFQLGYNCSNQFCLDVHA